MDTILQIENAAMEAWRQGDPMKWIDISSDSVVYMDPGLNSPIVGKAEYIRYLEPIKGLVDYDASEFVKPQVAAYGDTAVLTYNYHSLKKDQGGALQRTSFFNTTEVYRKIQGKWKIVHTHWSFIQHRLPETSAAPVLDTVKNLGLTGTAEEVMRLETRAREMWSKGDPSGYLDLCFPEASFFHSEAAGRIDGIREIKKELYDSIEYSKPHIQLFEDSVVLFYQFIATKLNPDGSLRSREPWNCTAIYIKTAGGWKIAHIHWSYVKGPRDGGGI